VPAVVSREMEETWIAERQIQCEANREHVITTANLEFARFVEMTATICGATFVLPTGGTPLKPVHWKRSLRKCWYHDGSADNAEMFSWMLYFAPTCGHKRFREGKDWSTWKEECFMRDGDYIYETAPGQAMPRIKCVKTLFSRFFNKHRNNVLAPAPHGARLQLENPNQPEVLHGEVLGSTRRRFTRRNRCTFFIKLPKSTIGKRYVPCVIVKYSNVYVYSQTRLSSP
jgi:hypothetical protein